MKSFSNLPYDVIDKIGSFTEDWPYALLINKHFYNLFKHFDKKKYMKISDCGYYKYTNLEPYIITDVYFTYGALKNEDFSYAIQYIPYVHSKDDCLIFIAQNKNVETAMKIMELLNIPTSAMLIKTSITGNFNLHKYIIEDSGSIDEDIGGIIINNATKYNNLNIIVHLHEIGFLTQQFYNIIYTNSIANNNLDIAIFIKEFTNINILHFRDLEEITKTANSKSLNYLIDNNHTDVKSFEYHLDAIIKNKCMDIVKNSHTCIDADDDVHNCVHIRNTLRAVTKYHMYEESIYYINKIGTDDPVNIKLIFDLALTYKFTDVIKYLLNNNLIKEDNYQNFAEQACRFSNLKYFQYAYTTYKDYIDIKKLYRVCFFNNSIKMLKFLDNDIDIDTKDKIALYFEHISYYRYKLVVAQYLYDTYENDIKNTYIDISKMIERNLLANVKFVIENNFKLSKSICDYIKIAISEWKENIQKYLLSLDRLTKDEYIDILNYICITKGKKMRLIKLIIDKGYYSDNILVLLTEEQRVDLLKYVNPLDSDLIITIFNIFEGCKKEKHVSSQLDCLGLSNNLFIVKLCAKYGFNEIYSKYKYDIDDNEIEKIIDIGIYYNKYNFIYNNFSQRIQLYKCICKNVNTYTAFTNKYKIEYQTIYIKYALDYHRDDILQYVYSNPVTFDDKFINDIKKLNTEDLVQLLEDIHSSK